jgi:predicted PhzF superfamily epimerase YddE/YHI9
MPALPYFIVDAFTSRPFSGNPAAVVPLESWPDNSWLQSVAMEMNLSETAFFVRNANGYDLRWFTPQVEVDLCGHATLATAKVISHLGLAGENSEITFASRSGPLLARLLGGSIELDFPLIRQEAAESPLGLVESLGITPKYVGKNRFDYLLEVGDDDELRRLKPDFQQLSRVACRGVIVTARSADPAFDFVSRFFAPAAGINEDPVTGSAHCCLADYWGKKLGRLKLTGYQASARGGIVRVETVGDRVMLRGDAVIVAQGELLV